MIEAIPRPQYLDREQVHRLIDAAAPGRDRLFIRVSWETGARVSEILALQWCQIPTNSAVLRFGSGDALREVPISSALSWEIDKFKPRPFADGWVFDFTRQTAWKIVRKAGQDAGLGSDTGRNITPDALRHSFAMHCLMSDVPLAVVREIMGITPLRAEKYSASLPAGAAPATDPARLREFLRKVQF